MTSSFQYAKQSGITLEDKYPYTGRAEQCHYDQSMATGTVQSYVVVEKNEDALKQAVGTVSISQEKHTQCSLHE